MTPTEHSTLPCAVFGHNYVIIGMYQNNTTTMACKHCGSPLKTNANGDFIEEHISNTEILQTLRRLVHINLKAHKSTFDL